MKLTAARAHALTMNKFFGLIFVCMAACASCSSSESSTPPAATPSSSHAGSVNMLCFTSTDARKIVVSRVFTVKTYPPERMIEEPWAKDFRRYIGQSGNEGGISVTCAPVNSSDAAKAKADELRKQGHEVAETTWTYAGE